MSSTTRTVLIVVLACFLLVFLCCCCSVLMVAITSSESSTSLQYRSMPRGWDWPLEGLFQRLQQHMLRFRFLRRGW